MNSLLLIILLTVTITDSSGIIHDNQSNYSNGIIINQSFNDEQNNYSNGILIFKDSVVQDEETTSTPIITPAQTSQSTSSSSSSEGGSSGGGGISSSENFSNILKWEERSGTLIAGQPVSFKFNLSVYEILLIGSENEYDVSVRVELLKDKPQKATTKPAGEVIQYFNVATSTKRMRGAILRLRTDQTIGLLKWDNKTTWRPLPSIDDKELLDKLSNNSDVNGIYYSYRLESDQFENNGIGSFAIVKSVVAIPTSVLSPETASETTNTATLITTPKQSPSFGAGIAFVLIIGLAVWQHKKRS